MDKALKSLTAYPGKEVQVLYQKEVIFNLAKESDENMIVT